MASLKYLQNNWKWFLYILQRYLRELTPSEFQQHKIVFYDP